MMNRMGVVIGAALLAACGASGQGDGQTRTSAATAKPVDVGGVRLGMTKSEAEAAMRAGGWTVKPYPSIDWNETVDNEISIRRTQMGKMFMPNNGVGGLEGRKGDEELGAVFEQTPQGERVQQVAYAAPRGNRTFADFRAELIRRYGKAVVDAEPNRGPNLFYEPQGQDGFTLTSSMDATRVHLSLDSGAAERRAWMAMVDRAATAKVGPVGKSF